MEIKTKENQSQRLNDDVRVVRTKTLMKQAVIKQKQSLEGYRSTTTTNEEKSGDSYAVNRTEDASKSIARAGKAYAIKQHKKHIQQKRYEKENITSDPIKAYGDSFSFSDSFRSAPKFEESADFDADSPVRTMQGAAKAQIKEQMIFHRQKTAGNAAVQNQKKRAMRSWNRSRLLQKNEHNRSGSMLYLPRYFSLKESEGSKAKKGFDAVVKRRSPIYLMVMGFLLLMVVIVLLFSSAMAVIGEDEAAGDIPANGSIVEIAESQIGNQGGRPYWSWYGFSEHVDWCACFVSWCADKCGYIENGEFPKFSYCQDGVNWFIQKKAWYRKTISPSPGMIIFFDWDGNGTADHVGIVKLCKDNIVRTIEGNSGDMCKENWYPVGNKMIMGYGGIKNTEMG